MKLAVLWAVAACVAAVDLPCEEYCICLLKEAQKVAYQPECNCNNNIENVINRKERFGESKIYYEPIEYIPVPSLIYEQPFVILNPYAAIRKKHFSQATGTQIQINIEKTDTPHNRREKDTLSNDSNTKHTSIYLDIDLESDSGRSAFTVPTPEDLNRTKESLIECATLYTVLDYRNAKKPELINTKSQSPFAKFDNFSDAELIQKIKAKCSQFSYLVEKSRKEIKDNRPKKTTDTSRMSEGEQQTAKKQREEPLEKTFEQDLQSQTVNHVENQNTLDDDERTGQNVIIYTESQSNEYSSENFPAASPQETEIDQASSSNDISESSFRSRSLNDEGILKTTERVTYPDIVTFNDEGEYLLSTETTPLLASSITETTTGRTITDDDSTEDLPFIDQELVASETVHEGRAYQKENETALPKIVTHEFNNTVESLIDGTEDFVNSEFEDGPNHSVEDLNKRSDLSTDEKIETTTPNRVSLGNSDLSGKLYFLYKQQHIPARFIQKPNGTLNVGIDGDALCNKLTQDGERKSPLLSTLCNCYKFDNCSSINKK